MKTLSPDGIATLSTLQANLKKAIRDHETVTIGGGQFAGADLAMLLVAVEMSLEKQK